MPKILSSEQLKAADQFTIANEPISSIDLMERASFAISQSIIKCYPNFRKAHIVCGIGNNGGDGLAIGRILHAQGYNIAIYVVGDIANATSEFNINYKRVQEHGLSLTLVENIEDFECKNISNQDVIIDAIFGIGLKRPIQGLVGVLIKLLNNFDCGKVAIDIASGLFSDRSLEKDAIIFKPDYTFTCELPKLAFFMPENSSYVGEYITVPIGLDADFVSNTETNYGTFEMQNARHLIKKRERFSHKGTYGHVFLIAGSKGKMGAAILAARACLRSGVGLLTIYCPNVGYDILQTAVPEAMVICSPSENHLSDIPDLQPYTTIAIGPGIGIHPDTVILLESLLSSYDKPMVIDADALNIISAHRHLIPKLVKNTVLTPHPKEFSRLVGDFSNDFEKISMLQDFCKKYKVNLILKGAYSAISDTFGKVSFNTSGNAGMATGGSGDVLTGIVAGLLSQGYSGEECAKLGAFIHGLAGDQAASNQGQQAMIASDLIENIGRALLKISS